MLQVRRSSIVFSSVAASVVAAACTVASPALPAGYVAFTGWPGAYDIPGSCVGQEYIVTPVFDGLCAGVSVYAVCTGGTYSGYVCASPGAGWTSVPFTGTAVKTTGDGGPGKTDAGHPADATLGDAGHPPDATPAGDARPDAPLDAGIVDASRDGEKLEADASEAGGGSCSSPLPACATPLWTIIEGGGATVTRCGLMLPATLQGNDGVDQAGLVGDFTVTVTFDGLSVGDSGLGNFKATVNGSAAGVGSVVYAGSSSVGNGPIVQAGPSPTTSGVVVFQSSGTTSTLTLTMGGQNGSIQGGAISPGTLYLATEFGATVNITSVAVTGSTGTFQADVFHCDSVQ
jgi:hypothetical protein